MISNWEDSPFDLRRRGLTIAEPANEIVITNEVAAALRDLQLLDPDCERLVFRIRAQHDGAVLAATDDDLDELIGSVAAEANHEPNRRRQQRLDAAFEALNDRSRLTAGEPMALPELDVARVQRWCAARVPEHARHQVRVECQVAPRHLTIVERRAPWREDFGPEWTSLPDRPPALHRRRQVLDPRTGATATSASTSTPTRTIAPESTTCSPRSTTTPPASSGADQNG